MKCYSHNNTDAYFVLARVITPCSVQLLFIETEELKDIYALLT